MTFTHDIGGLTLPINSATDAADAPITALAVATQAYLNATIANAWKAVSGLPSTFIQAIHYVDPYLMAEVIRPQMPCLFVWREATERERFTCIKDKLTSDVCICVVLPMTPTIGLDRRIGILNMVNKSVESMVHREQTIDGYYLLEQLDIESLFVKKTEWHELKTSKASNEAPGFLVAKIRLEMVEIVEPSDEGCEDLDHWMTTVHLDGYVSDGYAYPWLNWTEIGD